MCRGWILWNSRDNEAVSVIEAINWCQNPEQMYRFDLEGHGQSPHKTIGILTKVFYTTSPNLVILAWTVDVLLRGQAQGWYTNGRTDTHTDGHRQRQYPKTKTGLGWKILLMLHSLVTSFYNPLQDLARCLSSYRLNKSTVKSARYPMEVHVVKQAEWPSWPS